MQTRQKELFTAIRSEGGLLPIEFIRRIESFEKDIAGSRSSNYHLVEGETILQRVSADWARMKNAWQAFKTARCRLTENDTGTSITREKLLLPMFSLLEYGRLDKASAFEIEGKHYAVSHIRGNVPIHLVGCKVDLDKRSQGVAGASRSSPYSMVQEFLNRRSDHLWAFVSNGIVLRILRDNVSLTRLAYIEFDLETLFENEVYSDFKILWLLCHQSRFEAENAAECYMEQWVQQAREQGTRMLEDLRSGVEKAIAALGAGFIDHHANATLRERLQSGELDKQEYYRMLLRLVYRMIFLFTAEDRDVLFAPDAIQEQKKRYLEFYSTRRLRMLAGKMKGSVHGDLWQSLVVLMQLLQKDGCSAIGIPPLGSMLWSYEAIGVLNECSCSNSPLLDAIRALAFTSKDNIRMPVDYRNMGTEELGSVYEALLELHPDLNTETGKFELRSASGNERKTSGSYYTPSSLINCLLDSALEPVLREAEKKPDPEKAFLELKICDPAAGSGHFLIAAAHRMAKRLAALRTNEEEPPPDAVRHALRDVISQCIYGVDINPMAVELCKISLWMEAMEPGKPLTFIDHHIRCGNSLLGTTPALLNKGIPDAAFNPIEGDDKKLCTSLKKQNKQERGHTDIDGIQEGGQISLLTQLTTPVVTLGNLTQSMLQLDEMSVDDLSAVDAKKRRYESFINSQDYLFNHLLADAWCSAFVIKKDDSLPFVITHDTFQKIKENPFWTPPWLKEEIGKLREQYQFFHWHLEFPDVFRLPDKSETAENEQCGWCGGFDCVLGNPPWERVKVQEKEWFSNIAPDISNASNAAERKEKIKSLSEINPVLFNQFVRDQRKALYETSFLRNSNVYPKCGVGDINTFAVFAELKKSIKSTLGYVGSILPPGIVTADTTKLFTQEIVDNSELKLLYNFTNRGYIFIEVESTMSFCLIVLGPPGQSEMVLASQIWTISDLQNPDKIYTLSNKNIESINPNTKTLPVFRTSKDAEIAKSLYLKWPVICNDIQEINPWELSFGTMFHMSGTSDLFYKKIDLEKLGAAYKDGYFFLDDNKYVPLFESKLGYQFNHRHSTFEGIPESALFRIKAPTNLLQENELGNPFYSILPRYWVEENEIKPRLPKEWNNKWLFGFRRTISAVADARSSIFFALPQWGVGDSVFLFYSPLHSKKLLVLLSLLNSFMFDYMTKQKAAGGNFSFFIIKQLPIVPPSEFSSSDIQFITNRVLELVYTSKDMEPIADSVETAFSPFIWNSDRRFTIRCELDAMCFHYYLGNETGWSIEKNQKLVELFPNPRSVVEYVLDSFSVMENKDREIYGTYRTKDSILEIYDEMAEAIRTGKPYQTKLDPPPGDIRCTHGYKADTIVSLPDIPTSDDTLKSRDILPFTIVDPAPGERYKTCIPLYDLEAAAGPFGDYQQGTIENWVSIKDVPINNKMFIARITGDSMEPDVPDGSYCLFEKTFLRNKHGKILLVQLRDYQDPEIGGKYYLKKCEMIRGTNDFGEAVVKTRLVSLNPKYRPIELDENSEVAGLAELVKVL